ncbi:BhlA/UviB family holin-like peptide [Clostridium sp. KNHs214]|uniref:BhlA/UviB family holin-like peptide n=1 Tax=Clostridium sp. KNHs214 TaxID=1540257 RepID=UPI0005515F6A|nr:BhlA/UviB family holin-like peptide [Clostridium sp. KNHs214]
MENQLIKLASSQSIWAALSVALIFYILKTQEKRDQRQEEREKNYQQIIFQLTEELKVVEHINENIENSYLKSM